MQIRPAKDDGKAVVFVAGIRFRAGSDRAIEVFHLVGRVCTQHQSQGAVVACFFVLQDFGGFLFGFFKTASKYARPALFKEAEA